jgi:[acyl-carrier-protein] S-malonyltransferase
MQAAVPAGEGAMAAVIGLEAADVQACCAQASAETGLVVAAANLNAPTQIVISGATAAVEHASTLLKQAHARRVLPLPVSAPFHCTLMQPAQDRLAPLLAALAFQNATIPVVPNVLARPECAGEALCAALVEQVTGAVRWVESIETIRASFAPMHWIEVGPGRVLAGLLRQIDRDQSALHVDSPEALEKTLTALAAPLVHATHA